MIVVFYKMYMLHKPDSGQHKPWSACVPFVFQPRSLLSNASNANGSDPLRLSSGRFGAGRGCFCVWGIASRTWHNQRLRLCYDVPAIRTRLLLSKRASSQRAVSCGCRADGALGLHGLQFLRLSLL